MIHPIEYANSSEMMAAYADRRRRLMGMEPKKTMALASPFAARVINRAPVDANHHVLAYHAQRSGRSYVAFECMERGISVSDLQVEGRFQEVTNFRGKLSYVLRTKFGWGYPKIGAYFCRDQASILNCVTKYCQREGLREPNKQDKMKITAEVVEKVRVLYEAGFNMRQACIASGVSITGATKRAIKDGWYRQSKKSGVKKRVRAIEQMKVDYHDGMLLKIMAEKHAVTVRTIARIASEQGWHRPRYAERCKSEAIEGAGI